MSLSPTCPVASHAIIQHLLILNFVLSFPCSPPDYWEWIPDGCEVVDHDREADEAICHCYHFGIFAITTDMYDPDVSRNSDNFNCFEQ